MPFFDSAALANVLTGAFIRDLDPAPAKPARRAAPAKRRQVNWRSKSTRGTVAKQAAIRDLLASTPGGLSVTEIGAALGMSRQLALYHVKKMAATYQLVMQLEPCILNGGLQFRVWDEAALAQRYASRIRRAA